MLSRAFIFALIVVSGVTHAQFGPSVWEQLQHSSNKMIGKITTVDISNTTVWVSYKNTEGEINSVKLCTANSGDFNAHDGWLGALNNQRIAALRDAQKSGEIVELAMSGPWSPCLSSVSTVK